VHGIQFSRNFGQHYSITAGLDYCRGKWVVVMDCDLQDRPEEIPHLYAKAKEGYDIVLAQRQMRRDSLLKRMTSKMFYQLFSYLADIKYNGDVGNFRIMSNKVVENLRLMREQLRFLGALTQWIGFPTTSIKVEHAERFEGKTTYTVAKLLKLAIDTIIAYSDKPLRLSVNLGFFMVFFSFSYSVYIVVRSTFFGVSIPGWSSLIVSLYFIGGIIISILGIIGIYLGKTFNESKNRPLYIVRRRTINGAPSKAHDCTDETVTNHLKLQERRCQAVTEVNVLSPVISNVIEADTVIMGGRRSEDRR
jgi:dolichol-phosphate mannosyltransferase